MVLVKILTTISTNFNSKKAGIVEMVMIKFGLTILTTEILGMVMVKFGLTMLTIEPLFWLNGQKIVVIGPPPSLIRQTRESLGCCKLSYQNTPHLSHPANHSEPFCLFAYSLIR
jgi:hypothetical protein